ncbi:hypothetical protein D3C71_1778260 [compost metagenome]
MKITDNNLLVIGQFYTTCRFIFVEHFFDAFKQFNFLSVFLVAAFDVLTGTLNPLLNALNVSKNQFQINGLNVADRIYFSIHVGNVLIFKTTNDMNDSVYFANMS